MSTGNGKGTDYTSSSQNWTRVATLALSTRGERYSTRVPRRFPCLKAQAAGTRQAHPLNEKAKTEISRVK